MIRAAAAVLALALLPAAAAAQDRVTVPGLITDDDFYRLVTCAAPPGGDCGHDPVRWRADRPIRVILRRIDPVYLGRRKLRAEAALTLALKELNRAGADFRLSKVPGGGTADIEVFLLDLDAGDPIAGTGIDGVDGYALDTVSTRVLVDRDTGYILHAAIVFSTALDTAAYEAAMLTQLTRALGLMTAVDAPAYAAASALAWQGEGVTRLGPQDAMALLRLYDEPPR